MVQYNNDWFLNRIKEKRPNDYIEYKFLEPYKTSREKIKTIHIPCGKEIEIIPNTFISRGHGCPHCAIKSRTKKQTKSHKEFEKELPIGVIPLDKYKGANHKIKVHCFFCDSTYDIIARGIKKGCTRCNKRYNRNIHDIEHEINQETKGLYKLVSTTYKNAHTPITLKHIECGKEYKVTMANFRKGRRCSHCKQSIGEKLVELVLLENDIVFEKQKKFDNLKLKSNLSYDFYLPELKVLIEYQGEQHYKPVKHFGGNETFQNQQIIDDMKRKYAKDNGYTLIEIPYTNRTYKKVKDIVFKNLFFS